MINNTVKYNAKAEKTESKKEIILIFIFNAVFSHWKKKIEMPVTEHETLAQYFLKKKNRA